MKPFNMDRRTIIVIMAIADLAMRSGGRRKSSIAQIEQLRHFAKQGVKVRLK